MLPGLPNEARIVVPDDALPADQAVLPPFAGVEASPFGDARAVEALVRYFRRVNSEGLDHVRVREGNITRTLDLYERVRFLLDEYLGRDRLPAQLKELIPDFRRDALTELDKHRLGQAIEGALAGVPPRGEPSPDGGAGFVPLATIDGFELLAPRGLFLLNNGVLPAHGTVTAEITEQGVEALASYFRKFNQRVLDRAEVRDGGPRASRRMSPEERREYLLDVYIKQDKFVREVLARLVPTVKARKFAQLKPTAIFQIGRAVDRGLSLSSSSDVPQAGVDQATGAPQPLVALAGSGAAAVPATTAPGTTSVITDANLPQVVEHLRRMDALIEPIYFVDPPDGPERRMNQEERKAALVQYARTPQFARALRGMAINFPSPPTEGDMVQVNRAAETVVFGGPSTPAPTGGAVITADRVAAVRAHLEQADDFARRADRRKNAQQRAGELLEYVRSPREDGFRKFLKERFNVVVTTLDPADDRTLADIITQVVNRPGRPSFLSNINAQTILGVAGVVGDVAQQFDVPGVAPIFQIIQSPGFSNLVGGIGSSGLFGSRDIVIYESYGY
ncbi:hypothetical protein [Paludisphaera sp.]|uniref:hypothetical protein n=1 Tax=Paludisphaera sp. TaxID=2017432 RepID=UPI00301D911A